MTTFAQAINAEKERQATATRNACLDIASRLTRHCKMEIIDDCTFRFDTVHICGDYFISKLDKDHAEYLNEEQKEAIARYQLREFILEMFKLK